MVLRRALALEKSHRAVPKRYVDASQIGRWKAIPIRNGQLNAYSTLLMMMSTAACIAYAGRASVPKRIPGSPSPICPARASLKSSKRAWMSSAMSM